MKKFKYQITFLLVSTLTLALILLFFGFNLSRYEASVEIIKYFKIPKILTAFFAGGLLSLCGLLLQNFLKNPLAEPHILGIQSASSFFIVLYLLLSLKFNLQDWGTVVNVSLPFIFSLIGPLIALFMLIFAFRFTKNYGHILIVGVLISVMFNSLTSFLMQWLEAQGVQAYLNWTFGSFENCSNIEILFLLVFSVIFVSLLYLFKNHFDVYSIGRDVAESVGLEIKNINFVFVTLTSIATAIVTSLCGPISFVGFVAPHLAKAIFKTGRHKVLIPACFVTGSFIALLLQLISDLFSPMQVSLSTVSGILSIPVILFFILRGNKRIYA